MNTISFKTSVKPGALTIFRVECWFIDNGVTGVNALSKPLSPVKQYTMFSSYGNEFKSSFLIMILNYFLFKTALFNICNL
mgnify:CR=1 FL=1